MRRRRCGWRARAGGAKVTAELRFLPRGKAAALARRALRGHSGLRLTLARALPASRCSAAASRGLSARPPDAPASSEPPPGRPPGPAVSGSSFPWPGPAVGFHGGSGCTWRRGPFLVLFFVRFSWAFGLNSLSCCLSLAPGPRHTQCARLPRGQECCQVRPGCWGSPRG